MARAPGRPGDDPLKQEERAARHAERKRVESVLPQRAKDCKLNLHRKVNGRIKPGVRPVLSVLVSELEEAQAAQVDTDTFLQDKLADKLGENAPGTYEVITVDKRNVPLSDVPRFDVVFEGEAAGGEGADGADGGDDEGDEPDRLFTRAEQEEYERLARMERGDPQAQFQQAAQSHAPPPPGHLDTMHVDDLGRRNREEAKSEAQNSMALLMQVMAQSQQAAQQANQQQTTMFLAMMERMNQQQQAPKSNVAELLAALAPLLAPVIAKMVDKAPDPIILELLKRDSKSPSDAMLTQIPVILGQVAEQQMRLQSLGAESTAKAQAISAQTTAETQAKINSVMMTSVLGTLKASLDDAAALRAGRTSGEGEEKAGGFGDILGKVAAAVLPRLMGGGEQPAQVEYEQPQQAPAALPAPQPAQRVPAAPTEPTAPQAPRSAAPSRPQVRDAASKIRGLLSAVADLRSGRIPADQRWGVVRFILNNAPGPMKAAILAGSFEGVMRAGEDAVLVSAPLLQWLADAQNQEFLKDILEDARKLSVGPLDDTYVARKVAELQQLHEQARGRPRARRKKQGPPPVPPTPATPTAAETPATPPAAPTAPPTPPVDPPTPSTPPANPPTSG